MAGKSERLKVHHQQRSDTAANWTANNPVLLAGEMGVESDTFKFKFGDGTSRWSTLPYVNTAGGTGAKGDKGDPGADGAPGKDGVTPAISVTASVSQTTGTPAVEVTQSGTTAAPKFDFAFSGIKGERGDTGAQGAQGATGAKGDAGAAGKSAYEIWKAQSGNSGKTETEFLASLKGAKGDTGARGPQGDKGETGSAGEQGIQGPTGPAGAAAGFGTPIASVDTGIGAPGVTVTASGPDTAKVFSFAFKNLKGATGAQGVQGAKGADGAPGKDGVTPAISVTASVSQTTGTPAVEVTQSGTTAAPKFDFAFSGIKGERGDSIDEELVYGLIEELQEQVSNIEANIGIIQADIKAAIEEKGVTVGDVSLSEYADKIRMIDAKKPYYLTLSGSSIDGDNISRYIIDYTAQTVKVNFKTNGKVKATGTSVNASAAIFYDMGVSDDKTGYINVSVTNNVGRSARTIRIGLSLEEDPNVGGTIIITQTAPS